MIAFASAEMKGGFLVISDILKLERQIECSDVVITGEGCTDLQSMMGKVVGGIADISAKHRKKCIIISGIVKDAEMLSEMAGVPVELYDERLTTVSAHNILSELNVRGKKRKNNVDELSATLILQDYIDRNMK